MPQQTVPFSVGGGLDLVSGAFGLKPGRVIAALNYEPVSHGYKRLRGFERFDGRPAPSEATYWRVNYTGGGFGTGVAPAVGDILYNGASDHFIVVAVVVTAGSFAAGNAAGYFVATSYTGTINPADNLFTAPAAGALAATAGTITLEYDFGAAQNNIYRLAAIVQTRAKIAAVSGSGPVRGVWFFDGEVLAFRDNAGATAGIMKKATADGWTTVANLTRIDFICDTATQTMPRIKPLPSPPNNPQQIANVSGGAADATIRSAAIVSTVGTVNTCFMLVDGLAAGQWTAGGQIIYEATTATQFGTTTAAPVIAVIPAGGRYFFVNHNFYGVSDFRAMYAVNGVGHALVYDGTGFGNISVSVPVDQPTRIAVHKQSLFLAFPGGSNQFSEIGEPTVFNAILGAGEIAIGNEIADYLNVSGSLAILGKETISVLYGNDETDYTLETLNDRAGALPYTAQWAGQGIYMDNRGLRSLSATAAYGNFAFGTLSRMIEPLLNDLRRDGVNPVLSFVARAKDQYWLFFDDKTGIVLYVGKKDPEIMPFKVPIQVTCGCSVEIDGVERIFVGADDGFVYEWDKGTSFDGAAIEHYVRLPFNNFGSPRLFKRIFKVGIDLDSVGTTTLLVSADLDLGAVPGVAEQQLVVTTGGGAIDSLGGNELYYASQIETLAEAYIGAVGKNISLKIGGLSSVEEPHTISGVIFHVSPRGLER